MKKFIIGKKVGMTQVFNEDGLSIPVSVIQAGPCTVVQKKTIDNEGYNAVKIGFEDTADKKLSKPDLGQFLKYKIQPKKYLREFRTDEDASFEVGQEVNVSDMFADGDKVDISGVSKGKGFQGNTKRHGQKGGKDTHGSMYHRRPGSMGSNTNPARVFKGKKLPGHMGFDNVTVQNLDIVRVDGERNFILVKGAIPGPKGGLVMIKETVKSSK